MDVVLSTVFMCILYAIVAYFSKGFFVWIMEISQGDDKDKLTNKDYVNAITICRVLWLPATVLLGLAFVYGSLQGLYRLIRDQLKG